MDLLAFDARKIPMISAAALAALRTNRLKNKEFCFDASPPSPHWVNRGKQTLTAA
jgi:hypothetical protein